MSRATRDAFQSVARGGFLVDLGMDSFAEDVDETETEPIRRYIISKANIDWEAAANR